MEIRASSKFRWASLISSVLIFLLMVLFLDFGAGKEHALWTAAIAVMMSVLWITEAIPLAATSLLPLVLFPFLGIMSGKEIAQSYINSTIFLFMGGFFIAIAMEKWNLHKRISLALISWFGKSPSQLILGFMVASALISMWISNTATAVMLLPIGLAVITKLEDQFGIEKTHTFSIALMLGIAYACSVGGIGTLIGTPPNLVFQRIYKITFPDKPGMDFSHWMVFAIPISVIMLAVVWFVLVKLIYPPSKEIEIDMEIIRREKEALGKINSNERAVGIVFLITALLWIFRKNIVTQWFTIPGWSNLFPNPKFIDDGTVAILMSIVLFIIPSKTDEEKVQGILELKDIRKLPWGIILLFGGGFALAEGFVKTGLSSYLASNLQALKSVPIILLLGIISISVVLLTELTSNTATSQIVLPIVAALAIELKVEPMLLMVPATISASLAFMMPVATPPNAIVFGSGRLHVIDMVKAGIILIFAGVVVVSLYGYFYFG